MAKREGVRLLLTCDAEGCDAQCAVGFSTMWDISRLAPLEGQASGTISVEGTSPLPDGWVVESAWERVPTVYCPKHGGWCPDCRGAGQRDRESAVEVTTFERPPETLRSSRREPCERCRATGVVRKAPAEPDVPAAG